jgi:hypothetical protein
MKKARELVSDGCLHVEITEPDGATHSLAQFEQLQERAGAGLA